MKVIPRVVPVRVAVPALPPYLVHPLFLVVNPQIVVRVPLDIEKSALKLRGFNAGSILVSRRVRPSLDSIVTDANCDAVRDGQDYSRGTHRFSTSWALQKYYPLPDATLRYPRSINAGLLLYVGTYDSSAGVSIETRPPSIVIR